VFVRYYSSITNFLCQIDVIVTIFTRLISHRIPTELRLTLTCIRQHLLTHINHHLGFSPSYRSQYMFVLLLAKFVHLYDLVLTALFCYYLLIYYVYHVLNLSDQCNNSRCTGPIATKLCIRIIDIHACSNASMNYAPFFAYKKSIRPKV
jgi:hypothetical protein